MAGSAVRRVSHPPRLPMPTRAEKATATTRWRVFWPVGLTAAKKAKALSDTLAQTGKRRNKVQVSEKGASFFDLDFDRPIKYDAVNKLLMQRIPSSGKGFTIKHRAANGETEPETLEDRRSAFLGATPVASAGDRGPCGNSTGGAAPASGTLAIAPTPLRAVVASAACASRPPLPACWRSSSRPCGGALHPRVAGETIWTDAAEF